jgi:hypothetical protein
MRTARSPRLVILLTAFAVAACFLFLYTGPRIDDATQFPAPAKAASTFLSEASYGEPYRGTASVDINRVTNATLGFGKIMVVGLPERTDKRDAMSIMSALSGFRVEWVAGVRPVEVVPKARPIGYQGFEHADTYIGSWRAHMNAIRRYHSSPACAHLFLHFSVDYGTRRHNDPLAWWFYRKHLG